MPTRGLYRLILHPKVALNPYNIYLVASNQDNKILYSCQCYQIIEAIYYTYYKAIEGLFIDYNPTTTSQIRKQIVIIDQLELLLVKYLPLYKIPYYSLRPILENKGIISSIYSIINIVFTKQLGYNYTKDFSRQLYLVYSNQKIVLLIYIVQKEQQEVILLYNKYSQLLAMLGLFYQYINYIDIIYNTYSRSKYTIIELILYYNKNYLSYVQGNKSLFYYKEEVVTQAFNIRVIALFYYLLLLGVHTTQPN